jgi:hypothetical protein
VEHERLRDEHERLRDEQGVGLQETIARLRTQRRSSGDPSNKAGYQAGTEWTLRCADYSEIKWFTEKMAPRVRDGESAHDIIRQDRQGLYGLMNPTEALAADWNVDGFWQGFLTAVLDIWAQIGDAVEADGVETGPGEDR